MKIRGGDAKVQRRDVLHQPRGDRVRFCAVGAGEHEDLQTLAVGLRIAQVIEHWTGEGLQLGGPSEKACVGMIADPIAGAKQLPMLDDAVREEKSAIQHVSLEPAESFARPDTAVQRFGVIAGEVGILGHFYSVDPISRSA